MITITWACNQDILNNTDTKQTILTTNNRGRWRVFGNHGLDKSRVVFRKTNTTFHGLDDSGHNGMDSDNVINIKNGTGYCTYGWPNNDNDNDIDEDAGFYSSTDNVSLVQTLILELQIMEQNTRIEKLFIVGAQQH